MTSYDLTGVELVRVSTTSGSLGVVAEGRTDADVSAGEVGRDGTTLTVRGGSGSIHVRVPAGTSVVVGSKSGRVELNGAFDSVGASSESGRVSVDRAHTVDARSTSGRVEVQAADHSCRARTVSGSITVGESGDLDAQVESGSIRVERAAGTVRARATSGRIEIGIGGASNISAETMDGRIELRLAAGLGADVDLQSSGGRVENTAPPGNDCHVVARSVNGRIEVRKRVTESGAIAFTDIVGFTEFTASEGDKRAIELLDTKRRIVDELLPAAGRVVKELGDGLMLWIAEPDSTVRFCRDAQLAFRDASDEGPLPLWVRIGVHWGDPTERAGDLIGHDVNTAARIVGQAGPGESLASDVLVKQCDLTAAGVDAQPIGPVLMKGLPAAIWLYRLT